MLNGQIKRLRLRLGISQSELARRAGYSNEFISQVERGIKSPSVKALEKIARGLGVSASMLMETKYPKGESKEKLLSDIHKMISDLPVEKLKIIRDLIGVFPEVQNPFYQRESLEALKS
jgi:transcriptional regulator with XRE-family HTH domain